MSSGIRANIGSKELTVFDYLELDAFLAQWEREQPTVIFYRFGQQNGKETLFTSLEGKTGNLHFYQTTNPNYFDQDTQSLLARVVDTEVLLVEGEQQPDARTSTLTLICYDTKDWMQLAGKFPQGNFEKVVYKGRFCAALIAEGRELLTPWTAQFHLSQERYKH